MFKIWLGIEIIVTLNVLKILIHLYFKNLSKLSEKIDTKEKTVNLDGKWADDFLKTIVVLVCGPLIKLEETQLEVNMKVDKVVVQVAVLMRV